MKSIKLKALDKQYFDEAELTGEFCGTVHHYIDKKWRCLYYFVWLGQLVSDEYREVNGASTRFKRFVNCTIQISQTLEGLYDEEGPQESGVTVDLYC